MGYLWLLKDGFEIQTIPKDKRDKVIQAFCRMKYWATRKKDIFLADDDFYNHKFSYGHYVDFIYGSWSDFAQHPSLRGISQNTHQLLFNSEMKCPAKNKKRGDIENSSRHEGYTGFEQLSTLSQQPYIYDEKSWEQWYKQWLTTHPEEIDWSLAENNFFPNPVCIQKILKAEIEIHKQADKLEQREYVGKSNSLALVFHDHVMRKKGAALEAYAVQIGEQICTGNYYQKEDQLSRKEQKITGSHRYIYGLNKFGKKQYISIDIAHGMFEFHDEKGRHLGEFHFDGSKNAEAEHDHNLRCIEPYHI